MTAGVLGRKWLFKQEAETLWSLRRTPGRLSLNASCAGIEGAAPDNLLLQRPTASYFSLETKLHWVGGCGRASGCATQPNGTPTSFKTPGESGKCVRLACSIVGYHTIASLSSTPPP